MTNYRDHYQTRKTPQGERLPTAQGGDRQVQNSAGGYSFAVDDWTRLDRFLILGASKGSYYASERKLVRENAQVVERCLALDGSRTVHRIVEISQAGRAPSNDPALFALAMASAAKDVDTRRLALRHLPEVARIGTHLFHFAEFVEGFRGWGRALRRAVQGWYLERPVDNLAYQAIKYRQRDGWSHRDLLRLSSPTTDEPQRRAMFDWIAHRRNIGEKQVKMTADTSDLPQIVQGFEAIQMATRAHEVAQIVADYRLPREAVPTESLNAPEVWEALLPHMKPEALIRNLNKMTAVGLVAPMSDAARQVVHLLADEGALIKARLHPLKVLLGLVTYQAGEGVKGSLTWEPVRQVVDALDGAFYLSFGAVEPTGKRIMKALDVSGSMLSDIAGTFLTCRMASAALAMVSARVEADYVTTIFSSGGTAPMKGQDSWSRTGISTWPVSPRQRLDDIVKGMDGLPFDGTDCALPMIYAKECGLKIDLFEVYTDSETWAGSIHPVQALRDYRQATGIPAKLVVVGMISNGFSIADPEDSGTLDVVGFDTAVPNIINDFARS